MPGLLGDFTSWWDNRKKVGAANIQGLLSDPAATLAMLGQQTGEDMTQYAKDQAYNAGALRSVMPEVRDQAGQQMSGGLLGMTAYHGSPHLFDKFDMSKIGTGEGAQAYGHGLYFAENPKVAKGYQSSLSTQHIAPDGSMRPYGETFNGVFDAVNKAGARPDDARMIANHLIDVLEVDGTLKHYLRDYELPKGYENLYKAGLEKAQQLAAGKNTGNLYKVDIPDEAVAKMLDWDKPLSQQPAAATALDKIAARNDLPRGFTQALAGARATKYFDGQDLYMELTKVYKDAPVVANVLRDAGWPGIKYKDAGSRGAEGGTHNYVLFDDALAKIVSRE